jgi:putative sterol carrier protein
MKFLDEKWFEEHKIKLAEEFNETNRNTVELIEVYENCYGKNLTIWIHYKMVNGLLGYIERGEGEDNIPEGQYRCFGDYENFVLVCQGKLDPNKGIITGKFTLEGNLMKAMSLLGTYAKVTKAKRIPGMAF